MSACPNGFAVTAQPLSQDRRRCLRGLGGLSLARLGWGAGLGAVLKPGPGRAATSRLEWPEIRLLGGSRLLPADWVDTAAVVVFWATWCPYCARHNQHVQRLHEAAQGQRLRVLGVAVDGDEPTIAAHMQRHGLRFPVAVGQPALRPLFTPRTMVPLTAVVDRRGRLLQVIAGEMAADDVLGLSSLASD